MLEVAKKLNQPQKESSQCGHPGELPLDFLHRRQCDLADNKAVNSMSREAVFLWKSVCSPSLSMDPPITNKHKI